MDKSVMIVELREILDEATNQGYIVDFLSKGPEYDRESLNFADAEKFVEYDIVMLGTTQKKAEELRKKMEDFKQKDTVICWCMWNNFWCDNGGKYQVTTINESFCNGEIFEAINPSFEGFSAACSKLVTLNEGTLKK